MEMNELETRVVKVEVDVPKIFMKVSTSLINYLFISIHLGSYNMAGGSGTGARGPNDLLVLLNSTPTTHKSFLSLLDLQPLSHPSRHGQKEVNRLLHRLTASVSSSTSRDEEKAAIKAIRRLVLDDEEGYNLTGYGKAWLAGCLTMLGVSHLAKSYAPVSRMLTIDRLRTSLPRPFTLLSCSKLSFCRPPITPHSSARQFYLKWAK